MNFYKVVYIESEAGWGSSDFGVTYYQYDAASKAKAQAEANRTNDQNTASSAPSYYIRADFGIECVRDELIDFILKNSKQIRAQRKKADKKVAVKS